MGSSSNNDGNDDGDPLSGHKLCGYLQAILSVSPPQTIPQLSTCSIFSDGPNIVGFRSDTGAVLLPIPQRQANSDRNPRSESDDIAETAVNSPYSKRRRRRSGVVLVNGSMSVVHQLHMLVKNRCLKVKAWILGVSVRDVVPDTRVVVLVDVYLPIDAWSGWQFPRQGALAASFFKHVSCNWEVRRSLLILDEKSKAYPHIDDESIWSCSDCHVLGCLIHDNASGGSDKSLFDLHEIFKSLPAVGKEERSCSTRINPEYASPSPGIWDVADDVITKMLITLGSKDLVRVAATCRHLRALAASVMPCMKLKLFPHQEAAVDWMLKREHNDEVLSHPMYITFSTEDEFSLHMNVVSGEIFPGMAPSISDFRGGMFCDEPGLGKTVTALSLILKTHGTLAYPPHGVDVVWCIHDGGRKCGYYELGADTFTHTNYTSTCKRYIGQDARRGRVCSSKSPWEFNPIGVSESSESQARSMPPKYMDSEDYSVVNSGISSCKSAPVVPAARILRCTRSLRHLKRNLLETYGKDEGCEGKVNTGELNTLKFEPVEGHGVLPKSNNKHKRQRKNHAASSDSSETWVQCDACRKWRKLGQRSMLDASAAWFCGMNVDPLHQSCADPEEPWNYKRKITYFPGFYIKGTHQGKEQNVSFFTNVLKEHSTLLNSTTKQALRWLANLSDNKLQEMETVGVRRPTVLDATKDALGYHKIFQAFGLVRKVERGTSRWFYPSSLDNLAFDLTALKIALTEPLDALRLYLSGATLIVVPTNLVDHWKTQIEKHVKPGQLRVYVWTDNKKPSAHSLAWDYDIVITTFSRLSAEWALRKRSTLMQVHWLRVMLDEGHTLGSSVNLTNKFQMAISLAATNRWILTGTPTPNTPISQVGHLQPMLKFLHEEAYGQNQEFWVAGILRPFEAQMGEGRSHLLFLLRRIMISARKADLRSIPPCIKKATYLHFNKEHARSYNELVVTVRRNILMADWNDPSHVESLLNPKQWKFRSNTIKNVRLSCCVAGHIKVTEAGQDIQETMDILVQQGLDPSSEEFVFIKYSLLHGCCCFRCKDWCRLPVITPCRHLLCLDCVALDSKRCTYPGCGNPYVMQPPEKLTRPENPNPKWAVPKDLIELQPSYEQEDWDPDWQSTKSSKVAYLVERLKDLRESNWKMVHYAESTHNGDFLLYKQNNNYTMCACQEGETIPSAVPCKISPDKVIIFSQFLEHIHVIEQQLTIAGIRHVGMYNPMPSSNKMKSLLIFQHEPSCMVLLMDGSAALGLDLSFVTHVFLMEPIWDRSMEEQVISRAHRMGATRPIYVETLAMRGTIEEQMLEFLEDASMTRTMLNREVQKANNEGTRAHRTLHDFAENNYLSHLTFVHTNALA